MDKEKMLGVESGRQDLENFDVESFDEIKRVEAGMEAGQDMDCDCYSGYTSDAVESMVNDYCSNTQPNLEAGQDMSMDNAYSQQDADMSENNAEHQCSKGCCGCCCGGGREQSDSLEMAEDMEMESNNMEMAEDMEMNSGNMEMAEDMEMNANSEMESNCGCGCYGAMEAAVDAELREESYYRNIDTAYAAGSDPDFANKVQTANGIDEGMLPEEIAEQAEFDRETYEEFSEDFDESNPQESGYAGITDESNADSLELAADEYFDEDKGYTSTADYTMISDEDMGGS